MSSNRTMKGHKGNEEVSTILQGLAISSPQLGRALYQPRKMGDAGSVWPPQDKSSPDLQQEWVEEGDILSTESFVGLQLHENPPAVAAGTQVLQKDGDGDKYECSAEATELSSLPATVTSVEERTSEGASPTYDFRIPENPESPTRQPTDDSESKSEEGSGSGSLPWVPNIPVLASILPSSTSSTNTSDADTSSDQSGGDKGKNRPGVTKTDGSSHNLDVTVVRDTMAQVKESLQGFILGSPQDLQNYLTDIVSNPRDFGLYVSDKFKPSPVGGVMCYRLGKEIDKLQTLHQLENDCGVFLCQDKQTKQLFILKKIMRNKHPGRLIGVEFLNEHFQDFLPKILGVYKEEDTISIFQEYIEGSTLLQTNWNLAKVRQFAEVLLSAVYYLHTHGLVHADIKLRNMMVRSKSRPESLVLIDFESAKHPMYPFHKGGHTFTYLPPWYEQLLNLEMYDPVLKTVDLWAVACVIIFFLIPSEREKVGDVWSKVIQDIKEDCDVCSSKERPTRKYCLDCRKTFLNYLKGNGHNILQYHLGHLMNARIEDPNWKALRHVLEYLTDTTNIHEKNIGTALYIIKGPMYCQPAIEFDHDIQNVR